MLLIEARKILNEFVQKDGGLYNLSRYTSWEKGSEKITLDDEYTVEELEAIVLWIKYHNLKK